MNGHLKRVLILLLIFTFVFQMAGITSLERIQAYAEDEVIDVPEADEAEEMTTEEIDTESPGEIETDGENPPDAAEEPAALEAVPEETVEVPEEVTEVSEEPAEEFPVVEETVTANDTAKAAKAEKTGTVLAFTSDTHNQSDNKAAVRLGNWIDMVESKHGDIDVMAFGGDMAGAGGGWGGGSSSSYWTNTQADMDALTDKNVSGVYTTGNHEISSGGDFSYTTYQNNGYSATETKGQFLVNEQGAEGTNYRIYCLGSTSGDQTNTGYTSASISELEDYLISVSNDKPIFIITHFPLHYTSSRSTKNAGNVITLLNKYATEKGQKIVFLWGHNHTDANKTNVETHYDEIFAPGESITYASGSSAALQFYYAAAGCMSDSEYSTGSQSVKGKGLVVDINSKNQLKFTYYDANGNNVTEDGSNGQGTSFTEQDPVAVTDVTIDTPQTTTVEVGRTITLSATVLPADATNKSVSWSSSDPTVATVDANGKVKGIKEGQTTITVTSNDTTNRASLSDSIEINVVPRTAGGTVYVLANELTDGGSYLIVSSKTEGNAYAVTNNGSSSSGTAMGSTAVTIESGDVNGDGTNELYIDSVAENIVWEATANGSGFNLTNDEGYLEGASGAVRVFKPQTYSTRYWTYSNEYLEHKGGSYTYEVYYDNGFTYRNYNTGSATHHIYIFEQQTITPGTDPVSGVTLNKSTLELAQGGSETLTATVLPATAANKNVSWGSSDTSVATVSSSGTVTGVAPGTATITVTTEDGNFTADCDVTVTEEKVIEYVLADTLEADQEYLIANGKSGEVYIVSNEAGAARQLKGVSVTVSDNKIAIPENIVAKTAFTSEGKTSTSGSVSVWLKNNGKYLYTNNADGLRMVESSEQGSTDNSGKYWHYRADGKNLLWYFKDTSSTDGYTDTSQTYKYYLECNDGIFTDGHASNTSLSNTNTPAIYLFVKKVPVTGVTVSPTTKEMAIGEVAQLSATVAPKDASVKTVTWSSSNTSVATVDTNGKVTGVAAGTATITVTTTDGNFTASCEVTVSAVAVTGVSLDKTSTTVETGKTKQLTATITPENATNKNVSWSSSNDAVATVDEDGVITGVAEGTATITVTTEDGNKTATCSVTVTQRIVRPGYVIVIDDYALSTEPETDYHPESSGTNKYYGLKGVAYDGESDPTEDILWTITPVEGKENTYYIQSMDGKYLNATYQPDSPIEGHLNLDNTPDEWVLDGDLEDWIISGSYLQSTNATTSSKELCLAYETVGSAGNINLFTIRSRSNADSSELTSPDITAEVRYEETNALKDGEEYIIAVTKDDGSVYAVKNVATGDTSANTSSVTLNVSSENGTNYIVTDDAGVPWEYTGSNQYMTNNSFYLSYSNNVPRASSSTGRAITYSGGNLRFARSTTGSYYYLTCSNGTFGTGSSSNAATVRLFEKRSTILYTIKWIGANGTILEEDELAKGDMPAYHGATPVKADDDQYTYTFTGWSPDVETVTGLAVYTAQFKATPKEVGHTVTFLAEDGETVIATVNVNHGTEWDEFDKPEAPEKAGYTFTGWANAPTVITEDVSVTATYVQVPTAQIAFSDIEKTYNGQGQMPTVTATVTVEDVTSEIAWNQYTIYYYSDEACTELLGIDSEYSSQSLNPDGLPDFRPTNAGTYYVKVVVPARTNADWNYYGNEAVGTFTIAKRSITIKAKDVTAVYDGQRHGSGDLGVSYEITEGSLVSGHHPSQVGNFANRIDVGETTSAPTSAKIVDGSTAGSPDVTANYDITFESGTVRITPAPLTITAVEKIYTYSGEAQGPAGTYTSNLDTYVTVEGLKGGDTLKSITLAGSKTDVGVYENEIVPSNAAFNYNHTLDVENPQNYNITYNKAKLTVNKATENNATVTLEGWTYGEAPKTPVTTATAGADTATYTYSTSENGEYTATVPTNAGTYYVKATIAETDNYVGAEATASFTISKGSQATPVVGHTDETISGKNDGTITGLTTAMEYSTDGETWIPITDEMLSEGSLTDLTPGTYYVRYAATDNYNASLATEVVIAESTKKLTVKFVDEDGTVLKTAEYDYGTPAANIEKPADPVKEATAQYTYTFSGWTPVITDVTADATYKATYTSTINEYTIKFVDEDGETVLDEQTLAYGVTPVYAGEQPTKEGDAEHSYVFAGWTPAIASVTGDAIYKATYTEATNSYTVTWYDYDGTTVLENDEDVAFGTTPSYDGDTPTRTGDAQYTYTFKGWTPEITTVTGPAQYTATYEATVNKYTIKFVNEDGAVLQSSSVAYGETPEYTGETPVKEATAQYTYTFAGWDKEITLVTGEATYTATYTSTVNKYTVTFVDGDRVIKEAVGYDYGTDWADVEKPDNPVKDGYAFTGWVNTPETVTENVTVNATWIPVKYSIVYNLNGGTNAAANPAEYTIENDDITLQDPSWTGHTFGGWYDNAEFTGDPVTTIAKGSTGNVTLYAKWTTNAYTVTWKNFDGTVLETDQTVPYGTIPEYDDVTPTKAATKDYRYEFAGWDPEIAAVTGDATYTAKFNEIARIYSKVPEWSWTGNDTDGYTSATATFKTNDVAEEFSIPVSDEELDIVTTPAECTETGKTVYTASVEFKGQEYSDSKEVVLPVLNHDWQFVNFTWTGNDEDGYTKAVANYRCKNDNNHTDTVEVAVSVETTPATCEVSGSTVYSATVTEEASLDGVERTDAKTVIINAIGHDWEFVDFTWTESDDAGYTAAVANYKCKNNVEHTQTVNAAVTSVTTDPTCEGTGSTVYTAAVTATDSLDKTEHSDNKTVTIPATGHTAVTDAAVAPTCTETGLTEGSHCSVCGTVLTAQTTVPALGHDWNDPTDKWNNDHTSVDMTFTCKNDPTHTHTETVNGSAITSEITTEPTATAPGVRTYTATVTLDGKTYTVTDTEVIPATGSTVSGSITSFVGRTEEGQVSVQLFVGDSTEAAYTATVNNNETYTFAGVAAGTYNLTVSKKDHVTRTYEITVNGTAVTQDVKIHLLGDVTGDGKLTTADVSRVNSHVRKIDLITDEYIIKCGDVIGSDGVLTTGDVSRINSHVRKLDYIW